MMNMIETVKEALEILHLLGNAGGYGLALVFFGLWRAENKERIRYRNYHEETIREFPKLVEAVERNTEMMERLF